MLLRRSKSAQAQGKARGGKVSMDGANNRFDIRILEAEMSMLKHAVVSPEFVQPRAVHFDCVVQLVLSSGPSCMPVSCVTFQNQ